uniref:HNOB domain-containing protein n=1 Tax=Loa loa TaxID=7209 RepID=A0A1I7VPY2_LOALO
MTLSLFFSFLEVFTLESYEPTVFVLGLLTDSKLYRHLDTLLSSVYFAPIIAANMVSFVLYIFCYYDEINQFSQIGWFHECFRRMIFEQYGGDVWLKILNSCHLKEGEECMLTCYYDDEVTMELTRAISHVLNLSLDAVWEAFGAYFVHFVMKIGWDELLQALAYDLKVFFFKT